MPEATSALLEETPTLTVETETPATDTETEEDELELVLEDLVFEEITIDGICGVY